MDRLLQFVLFTACIFCSYGFRIKRDTSQTVNIQEDEFYGYNSDIYPDKLIRERLAMLSRDELKDLKIDRIGDRVGNSSSDACKWNSKDFIPRILPAADELQTNYFLVPMENGDFPSYEIQVCDTESKGQCYENIHPGNRGCCFPMEEKQEMVVVFIPVDDFDPIKYGKSKKPFVKKMMNIMSKCSCLNVKPEQGDNGKCDKQQDFYLKQREE